AAQSQNQSCEQPDRARSHHRRSSRAPNAQSPLNLICLGDPLFDNGRRFQQHSDFLQALSDFDDELGVINVIFSQIAMAQINSAFEVSVIRGHIVCADQIVNTRAGPADGGNYIVAGFDFGDVGTNRLDSPEALVTKHQKVITFGRGSVFGGIDLLIVTVHAYAQNFHKDTAAVWNVSHRGLSKLGQM